MALSISTNTLSLSTQRSMRTHDTEGAKLTERLSSGMRINRASDDAAGQAITSRLSSNLRGVSQAMRSLSDATSMLQVADGAMASVTDTLQRLREMAVAAGNGSYTDGDRGALQKETQALLQHITQVGTDTSFNGQALFSQDTVSIGGDERRRAVLDGLQSGWLSSAEDLIKQHYGLMGDGAKLTVNLDTTDGGYNVLASVSGTSSGGKLNNLHLNIDMADFGTAPTPDGGSAPLYSDRIVAHEMVHAVMGRTMNMGSLPQWFVEGTAELINGADERLAGAGSIAGVVATIAGGGFSYEGGYAASRYLHDRMKGLGVEGGIKGIMQYLNNNQSADLDAALNAVSKGVYTSSAAFLADFGANGEQFINTKMNLTNADTGAIGGLDADGGPVRDARAVVPASGTSNAADGLAGFNVVYPDEGSASGVRRVQVQAGDSAGDLIDLQFSSMNARALGLANLDMTRSSVALLSIDRALEFVGEQRVRTGASSNRLDLAAGALETSSQNMQAARSRIQDTDYASDTAQLTRTQILQQAASAMLAQANGQPRSILSLLR
ncbi:flagellin [Massilia aurea]|uniref:Flagellin n=1 Tax=Massilia aurea TaxID=373040 RepID=A0A7W9U713_9BURK|nr:flagellinolysin [Massilia aurea]MBB6132145.1 flagellin [Massilia aurea]